MSDGDDKYILMIPVGLFILLLYVRIVHGPCFKRKPEILCRPPSTVRVGAGGTYYVIIIMRHGARGRGNTRDKIMVRSGEVRRRVQVRTVQIQLQQLCSVLCC